LVVVGCCWLLLLLLVVAGCCCCYCYWCCMQVCFCALCLLSINPKSPPFFCGILNCLIIEAGSLTWYINRICWRDFPQCDLNKWSHIELAMIVIVNQHILFGHLRSIFLPNDELYYNSRKESLFKYRSGYYMELDIWLPKHDLCFEFQDMHHYASTWYNHQPRTQIEQKDTIKTSAVHSEGLTLLVIPCWWDAGYESLAGLICFRRPDLLPNLSVVTGPISLNSPEGFLECT